MDEADDHFDEGLEFPWYTAGRFLATPRNMARNRRPKTTEKNMESMLIVQKVAGGYADPPARMYAGPAEGYSDGDLCNPAASYFLKP
jgi:hypothetical protein